MSEDAESMLAQIAQDATLRLVLAQPTPERRLAALNGIFGATCGLLCTLNGPRPAYTVLQRAADKMAEQVFLEDETHG